MAGPLDDLAAANARYAESHPSGIDAQPRRRLAVVTCMDARIDVLRAMGLERGDAHVLRNGGGLVTPDVLRSLAISQRALGTTAIALVHHTQCGMAGLDDAAFREELRSIGGEPPWDVPGFDDVDEAVRAALAKVRSCAWLPSRDDVRGYVFDVTTGVLREVQAVTDY